MLMEFAEVSQVRLFSSSSEKGLFHQSLAIVKRARHSPAR